MKLPDGSVFYYNPVFSAAQASPVNMTDESNFSTPPANTSTPAAPAPVPQTKRERNAALQQQAAEQRQAASQQFDAQIAQNVETSQEKTFNNIVDNLVRRQVESEFEVRMRDIKSPKEEKQIAREIEDRTKAYTDHWKKDAKPYYDAFVQARKHLDAAPPEQRALAKRAYQAAQAAWDSWMKAEVEQ
jgi:hypothetical protein